MDPRELNFNCKYKLVKPVNNIEPNRVAVICYGHLRSFLNCLPYTLNWASQYGVLDIYLHTWNKLDVGEEYSNNYINLPSIIMAAIGHHNLVSLTVDEQLTKMNNENKIKSWYYMYYSIWCANNQKKEIENQLLTRYQRCIKIRPDVKVNPKKFQKLEILENYYFSASDNNYTYSDLIAVTNSRTMDLICSHLSRVKENVDQDEVQKDFYQYISKTLGLKRAPFEYSKDWTIARKKLEDL